MTDAEKQRFDALFAMFESDGWRYLIADVERDIETLDNILAAQNSDDLHYRKGAVTALTNLKNYAEIVTLQMQQSEEED